MKSSQLTIRGFGDELARRLAELAAEQGISLNQAALRLLRKGAGVGTSAPANRIGHDLDDLAGTWTADEEKDFLRSVVAFDSIDESQWR